MVLVSFHRVTRRFVGIFVIFIALLLLVLLLGQIHHVYHQHQKFRRFEGYNKFVDDVAKDLVKLETIANQSLISVDRFYIIFGQHQAGVKQESFNVTNVKSAE